MSKKISHGWLIQLIIVIICVTILMSLGEFLKMEILSIFGGIGVTVLMLIYFHVCIESGRIKPKKKTKR